MDNTEPFVYFAAMDIPPSTEIKIQQRASELGLVTCRPFSPSLLKPEARIRSFCKENRCGRFGQHHMCPPAVGTIEEAAAQLSAYSNGLLLQTVYPLDVRNDPEGVQRTKQDFHRNILHLEHLLRESEDRGRGFIGGDCALCNPCFAAVDAPCPHPEQARTSLEAVAVDVMGLLDKLGLDTGFHADRVTWTGCLLYGHPRTM